LTNGVYVWAEDLRNLKKCLEVHKGLFAAYESQNEPNNFGNWTSQFKGKAPPWFADNWEGLLRPRQGDETRAQRG